MNKVKIAELKSHLSSILLRVRRGEVVTVYDRKIPIATLEPIVTKPDLQLVQKPSGKLRRPKAVVNLKDSIDVVALLRQDRDAR